MAYPWLRLWTEARIDPKLAALDGDQFRVWFNLLCFASEQKTRGVIEGVSEYLLAVHVASADIPLLTATCEKLVSCKVVSYDRSSDDSVCLAFLNFAKRQKDKPSDRPSKVSERVARHRAKKKQKRLAVDSEKVAELRALPYSLYLHSGHWQDVRKRAHEADGYACRVCGSCSDLNVHHRTYERLGCEEPDDVVTLCLTCHKTFHDTGQVAGSAN